MATLQEIRSKYQESFEFLQARKKRQALQLMLLSNLRRGDQNISSTLMLTLMDRVMAGVYDDKIQVKFVPTQGITQDQINSYNTLAQSDYQEMGKAKLDYDWCWDSLFFGRGYLETLRFDEKRKILQPHVINPLVFGYDPYIENYQDWRYYWKWITRTKNDLHLLKKAGLLKDFRIEDLPSGVDSSLWEYKVIRDEAREGVQPPIQSADNDIYQILEFFGYNSSGQKAVYWVDKSFSKILYEKELDLGDGDEIITPAGQSVTRKSNWPLVLKEAIKIPHSSIPISIADLLEDKHRAKSVLLNLAYIAAKDQANPIYGYNPDKVRDVTQFFQRQINQHIPMDDETAAWPLAKSSAMTPDLLNFISILTQEANEPVGTGQRLQPESRKRETATEVAIDQQLNDLAQSLQSKVMQFGEAEFWSHWFHRYAKRADKLKDKTANILGVKGVDTKTIDLTQFKSKYPPGVLVYSAKEAEYKDLVRRRDYMQLYPSLLQSLEPSGLRNFNKFVFFPLFLQDPSLIDIMFPKTLDEMKAERENDLLKDGVMADVSETDDHSTHIYTHQTAMPKTWELWSHMAWHEELLAQQKKQQMTEAQQQMIQQSMGALENGKPQIGVEEQSPMESASPLKGALKKDNLRNNN